MNPELTQHDTQTPFDASMPTAAPGFTRFLNQILDCLFLSVFFSLAISIFAPEMMPKSMEELSSGPFISLMYPVQFVYYFVAEYFFGKTLAKVFTRTYVTTEYNEKPGFGAIFIRTLCRNIPLEYLSFLRNGIGWHDRLSKTYVVRAPRQ